MTNTKVKELMTAHPELISPDATLQEAAEKMRDIDCGILPVGTENNLEGIITDRDIVVRALAGGSDLSGETVRAFMTQGVCTCNEGDTLKRAADEMCKNQVSRLVVKDANGKVSGVLSFGGILRKDADAAELAEVVEHALGRKAA